MKWTIGLLVILGVVAAVCAVLLVNAIRVDDSVRAARKGEVPVVMVVRDLPAMSVLTADAIETDSVKTKEAPSGAFSSPMQVIGKFLDEPVTKGQVLTRSCIVTEGSSAELAALIPTGMRAVSVTLSSQSVSGGMLYPGCVVDVLASFKLSGSGRSGDSKGEAISTTLLHTVQVLAVAGDSVVSGSDPDSKTEEVKSRARSSSRTLTVTLLVDPRQAEALQLALDNGKIALAMRNPLDAQIVDADATVLNRGKLSKLGSLLGATVNKQGDPAGGKSSENPDASGNSSVYSSWTEPEPSNWEVTVIRGSKVAEEEVKNEE